MTSTTWHSFDYELKYRLGELTLARQRLRVLRKAFSLREIMAGSTQADRPPLERDHVGYLLADLPATGAAGAIDYEQGLLRYCLKSYQRCYIDMTGGFDAYQNKFSAKTRSNFKRKARKFAEQAGGLEIRRFTQPEQLDEFFSLARPVSAASYQERLLDCGLPDDPVFMEDSAAAAAADRLRAFVLFAQGRAVSYLYCPVQEGVLEYAYLGYAPDYAALSPGTVLQWLALESLFEERRFAAFDFTEGESGHKLMFSTHQVPCSVQLLLCPSASARMSTSTHRAIDSLSASVGRWLDERGLKSRFRSLLRNAA
jgi:CelD/BcsL family acetyltransferase involved in cellulose biosynthesis